MRKFLDLLVFRGPDAYSKFYQSLGEKYKWVQEYLDEETSTEAATADVVSGMNNIALEDIDVTVQTPDRPRVIGTGNVDGSCIQHVKGERNVVTGDGSIQNIDMTGTGTGSKLRGVQGLSQEATGDGNIGKIISTTGRQCVEGERMEIGCIQNVNVEATESDNRPPDKGQKGVQQNVIGDGTTESDNRPPDKGQKGVQQNVIGDGTTESDNRPPDKGQKGVQQNVIGDSTTESANKPPNKGQKSVQPLLQNVIGDGNVVAGRNCVQNIKMTF
ncbi:hypothetical protein ScPMuIL_003625 [Solemya velum]